MTDKEIESMITLSNQGRIAVDSLEKISMAFLDLGDREVASKIQEISITLDKMQEAATNNLGGDSLNNLL